MIVVDSSALVAVLIDQDEVGRWAADQIGDDRVHAPGHMRFEVSNVLRRLVVQGKLPPGAAAEAHRDLASYPLEEWSFDHLADRVHELWPNITSLDAAYVTVAEALDAPLLTLDGPLSRAPGPRCMFLLPPS